MEEIVLRQVTFLEHGREEKRLCDCTAPTNGNWYTQMRGGDASFSRKVVDVDTQNVDEQLYSVESLQRICGASHVKHGLRLQTTQTLLPMAGLKAQ
ncbi:hypothetical protein TcWFU_005927 [Taenia crassiceps]|uniref:Uncharacterized protein n=1 Tax=Taenia crassiceps TaxID=6207 RepID=A0ABR4Q4J0_9CEST